MALLSERLFNEKEKGKAEGQEKPQAGNLFLVNKEFPVVCSPMCPVWAFHVHGTERVKIYVKI
jgi:hypothetical protein